MSLTAIVLLIVGSIFLFIVLGVPVFAGLGAAGVMGLFLLQTRLTSAASTALIAIPQNIFTGIGYFALLAIPLYILSGELMNEGGITQRLIKFAVMLIGRVPGSLAHANIIASLFFGGITGSAQADTSCIGGILIPAQVDEGYTPEFSVAVTASSSTLGPIIPPSNMMVLYGVTVGCSISTLFMAGFVPGILIAIAECIVVILLNRTEHFPRREEKYSKAEIRSIGLSSQDSSVRMRTVERLFSQIELAASCGHRPAIMIGLLIGRRSAAGSSEEYYSLLADSLKRVADRACAKDIPVNLEPVNHLDSDALNTWQETAEFLDRSGCEYIRLGMDLYHMRLEERDIAATLRNYKHRIGCVQLMDDNRMAPGLGLFDTSALAGLVKELNYDGPVIMECLPGSDPESSLKTAADFYKRSFSDRT